jgi:hypothetical protein
VAGSYYSVDRRGFYRVDSELVLYGQDPLNRPFHPKPGCFDISELRAHIQSLFPDGLSLHGWHYLIETHEFKMGGVENAPYVSHEMVCELVFEYVRRAEFPTLQSRLQSYFGWESLEAATEFNKTGKPIYRLESDITFRGDQNWLTVGAQSVRGSISAFKYWGGFSTDKPKWEVLLAPPVRVMERVA